MRNTYTSLIRACVILAALTCLAGCGGGGVADVSAAPIAVSTPAATGPSTVSAAPKLQSSTLAQAADAAPADWEASPTFRVADDATRSSTPPYSPTQIRHAYGFDALSVRGAGQIIAIVDAYGSPTIQSDLATFCSQYGLPYTTSAPATLTIAYPGGVPKQTNSGWALETSLDVEWAHAIAPDARILLVAAKSASLSDLLVAVDYASAYVAPNGAKVSQVSMSWGGSEFSTEASYDTHFAANGVSYIASAGDSGAGVIYPSASVNVVAVGGTTLKLDSFGNLLSEVAWPYSGGGSSAYEPEPSWQKVWQSSGKRQIPDVAYDADPSPGVAVYDSTAYYGKKGWFAVGGTSAGAPQWAALTALANCQSATPMSSADATLYTLGAPGSQTKYFRDIVSGSNGFAATTGYDEVTGLGTPLGAVLVPAF